MYRHIICTEYDIAISDVQLEENLYENVEIRPSVQVARVVESDQEEEDKEGTPLQHDSDVCQKDRLWSSIVEYFITLP